MFSKQEKAKDSSPDRDNWVLVGLGNPGAEYEKTRHNLGFMLVDLMAQEFGIQVKREECRSLIGQAVVGDRRLELVKPLTYMNLSGEATNCLIKKNDRSLKRMIVAVDDLALPIGSIRLRRKGSAGGHNGLKSIIECAGTQEFIRLRIGIRPDYPLSNTKKFVLDRFSKQDLEIVKTVLERAADGVRLVMSDGVDKAMSEVN
ncbi:MAG: aminoacyl-tRNA hydrolase [Acidobacteria bacterium]|nr:aminoacyl-tRNA hydrolase [Acidobacteriota bacterium]